MATHQPGGAGGNHHESADQQHPHRLDRHGHHHGEQQDEGDPVPLVADTEGSGQIGMEGEQHLGPQAHQHVGHRHQQQHGDQDEIQPGDAEDVAEQQLLEAAPVGGHQAEGATTAKARDVE